MCGFRKARETVTELTPASLATSSNVLLFLRIGPSIDLPRIKLARKQTSPAPMIALSFSLTALSFPYIHMFAPSTTK
jgi:hypothetical protein